jgi:transcriptional regulator with XRE-family HTH domain
VKRRARTDRPFAEELPKLLVERGLSQRDVARSIGINQSHLSRLSGLGARRLPSRSLAGAVAEALDLPVDYFVEYRRATVIEAMDSDAALRERLYSLVARHR